MHDCVSLRMRSISSQVRDIEEDDVKVEEATGPKGQEKFLRRSPEKQVDRRNILYGEHFIVRQLTT